MRIQNSNWLGSRFPPREWQKEALPIALEAIENGNRGIVRAIMGAGKSVLIAEVCRSVRPDRGEAIVITAPTQKLVRQLSETVAARCGAFSVGQYYADKKQPDRPIIVACVDSTITLSEVLRDRGVTCCLWIADEAHRTETETIHEAMEALKPERALGFTATPYRAETKESLSLWDELIYDYGPREAIRDGVVVPWRIVHWTGEEEHIDTACLELIKQAKVDSLGPGVVNALTIDDASSFAAMLSSEGIAAEAVHSRQRSSEQEAILARLERGDIDVVVHVSLLQEGVDMPWLRWLCMRRPVKSRVRFAQEVGRVLRAHPGKEIATVFDPHDLFGDLKIDYDAVLGMDLEEEEEELPVELALDDLEEELEHFDDLPGEHVERRPRVMSAFSAYLRQLIVSFYMAGLVESRENSRPWRRDHPTDKQLDTIWRMKWVLHSHFIEEIPWRHRVAMAQLVDNRHDLDKGQASDLLNILFALKDAKAWPLLADKMSDTDALVVEEEPAKSVEEAIEMLPF